MILLKTVCFSLWFTMMVLLSLAAHGGKDNKRRFGWAIPISGKNHTPKTSPCVPVSLLLDDPEKAELQIYSTLRQLISGEKLWLEISSYNPTRPELYFIASRISRKYPAVSIKILDSGIKQGDPP